MLQQPRSNHNRHGRFPAITALLFFPVLFSTALFAAETAEPVGKAGGGGLLVTPKRVVFSGRTRNAELSLTNNGTDVTTYRLEFVEMRMDEAGRLVRIEEPDEAERPIGKLIRYSPRQVTIAPGEHQMVRLFVRKPADLPAGEYRSHLHLHAVPDATDGTDVEALEVEENAFVFRIKVLPGILIPIIVRHGELPATIRLAEATLDATSESAPGLALRLEREGERSVYGDLTAELVPDRGKKVRVGLAKGVAVYTTVASRSFSLPLHLPEGVTLAGGRLRIAFRSRPQDDGGGDEIVAERELVLP